MKKVRRVPIHRALSRPILFGGGERKLVMLNYTIITVLLFGAGLNTLTVITAILLATLGHMILVKLANYDSQFMQIYLRYRRYQDWYPAQSTVWCKHHTVRSAIMRGVRS
jgi:type IV secretory pathway TrbD component